MKAPVPCAPEAARCDVRCAVRSAAVKGAAIIKTATMIGAAIENARRNEAHTIISGVTVGAVIALCAVVRVCGVSAYMKAAVLRFRRCLCVRTSR